MTEQEVGVWTARLARIWLVEGPLVYHSQEEGFSGRLQAELLFDFWCATRTTRQSPLVVIVPRQGYGGLNYSNGKIIQGDGLEGKPFARQWLPLFRRNCWLSGCSLESTAHEKAQWMQDFSQEELEAWKLKI